MIDILVTLAASLHVIAGVAAAVSVGVIVLALPPGRLRRHVAAAGYPLAAAIGGLTAARSPLTDVSALVVVTVGGVVRQRARWAGTLLVTAGAAIMVLGDSFPGPPLLRFGLVLWVPLVVASIENVDRRWGPVTWPLVGISVLGVFAGVPEPAIAAGLSAALPALAVAWAVRAPVAWAAAPAGTLITLAAVEGGFVRPGAMVGALAGLGLLLVEPASHALARVWPVLAPVENGPRARRLLVVSQALVVALTSRVAGFRDAGLQALVVAVGALAIGWLSIREHRRHRPAADGDR